MKIITIKDGQKVTKAGVYRMGHDWYHEDCAPGPSLSSTMAFAMLNECPATVYHESYLARRDAALLAEAAQKKRPGRRPKPQIVRTKTNDRFDHGTACHAAVLEGENYFKRVTVVPAGNWSSPRAKFLKKQAEESGGVALLKSQAAKVQAMHDAYMRDEEAKAIATGGQNELSYFWQDPETGIWLKARVDTRRRLSETEIHLYDYKTTDGSVSSRAVAYRMMELGYFFSAAWYMHVVEMLEGNRPTGFTLVSQEKSAPHLINITPIGELAIAWGDLLRPVAIAKFAACLKTGIWPSYPRGETVEIPGNIEKQYEERKDRGEFGIGPRVSEDDARKVFGIGNDPKMLEAY